MHDLEVERAVMGYAASGKVERAVMGQRSRPQSFGPKVAQKLSLFSQLSAPIKSGLRIRQIFARNKDSNFPVIN